MKKSWLGCRTKDDCPMKDKLPTRVGQVSCFSSASTLRFLPKKPRRPRTPRPLRSRRWLAWTSRSCWKAQCSRSVAGTLATTARGGIPLFLRRCQKVETILAINFEIEFDIVGGAGAYGVSFWELQATQLLPLLIDDAGGDAFVELDRRSWCERERSLTALAKKWR